MSTTARSLVLMSLMAAAPAASGQFLFGRLQPETPQSGSPSLRPDVSTDGIVLAFESSAVEWVPGSSTGAKIIVVDLVAETIQVASTTATGIAFNGNSFAPSLSAAGRYAVFQTQADNLGLAVMTSGSQIVRKDMATGALLLASASAAGTPASGSASGQARDASVSADGRYVAFRLDDPLLVPGDSGSSEDVFVKDLQTGAIEAASVDVSGAFSATGTVSSTTQALSDDGRRVVFQSAAANLVPAGTGGVIRVYVRDLDANTTVRVSAANDGSAANSQSDLSAISPGGRFVSFRSFASNLGAPGGGVSRVFVRDLATATTAPVPVPTIGATPAIGCRESTVSDAGTVLYTCFFPGIADQVFLHVPGAAGTPFLVSSDINDVPGTQASGLGVAVDASGLSMAFDSRAPNLVADDSNDASDIFFLIDPAVLDRLFADGFE